MGLVGSSFGLRLVVLCIRMRSRRAWIVLIGLSEYFLSSLLSERNAREWENKGGDGDGKSKRVLI